MEKATQDPAGLWKLAKWAKNRGNSRQGFTPAIQRPDGTTAQNPDEKTKLLANSFPKPPEANLEDIQNFNYEACYSKMRMYRSHNLNLPSGDRDPSCPPITPREFQKALLGAKAGKAPGNSGIPNQVLHLALGALQPLLLPTMNFCLRNGIHPNNWKTSITVTL